MTVAMVMRIRLIATTRLVASETGLRPSVVRQQLLAAVEAGTVVAIGSRRDRVWMDAREYARRQRPAA